MGFFEGLDAEGYDRTYSDRELIGRIAHYFQPYRSRIAVAAVALVITSAAWTLTPVVVSEGVDLIASDQTKQSL